MTDLMGKLGPGNGASSARVTHSTAQTLSTGVLTTLAFDTERWDDDGYHDNVTNNSRLTAPSAGKYRITGRVRYASNSTGTRRLYILLNGTTLHSLITQNASSGTVTGMDTSALMNLTAGDYVELQAFQDSGGNLTIDSGAAYTPEFEIEKVA